MSCAEYVKSNLELYYPSIAEEMVEYEVNGPFSIIATLCNGKKVFYDDIEKTVRYLREFDDMSDEDHLREFGYRVNIIMRRVGMTQLDLSDKTGIPQPLLSRYLTGKTSPSLPKIIRIAKALGCSPDELMYMGD